MILIATLCMLEFSYNKSIMKRPISLTVLMVLTALSAFMGIIEVLIRPESSKVLFAMYGIVYSASLVVTIGGGLAFAYAMIRRIVWGRVLGIFCLISKILFTLYTTVMSLTHRDFMIEILTKSLVAQGRSPDGLAEYINSASYTNGILVTSIVTVALSLFFIWKLVEHKAYFVNTK
jgi:hypothetical protein